MPKVIPEYKEQAKKRILETAAEVFARKGYHEATMDDVAAEIGVSKGAVYQYFASKEELFHELCLVSAEELEESLKSAFTNDTLNKVAEEHMESELEEHWRGKVLMIEALAEAPRNTAVQKLLEENYARYVKIITKFIDRLKVEGMVGRGVDSVLLARMIVALRHGVIVSVMLGLDKTEAKRIWVQTLNLILEGAPGALTRRATS